MAEYIDRQAAIDAVCALPTWYGDAGCLPFGDPQPPMEALLYPEDVVSALNNLPPVGERWIPIKSRPMEEEERAEWSEKIGYALTDEDAVIYVSQLPDDGEEVFTCNRYGFRCMDTFYNDPDYGCYFEENGGMDGIVAWMPLPEPYKGGEQDEL